MKILVVDDEPDILETIQLCWSEEEDVDMRMADRGAKALQLMQEDVPDVLLTDFRMPHMDGVELIREVKRLHPSTMAFMMSAFPDPSLRERATEAGCDVFLPKPFDPFQLLKDIREAL